jgi:hypothetical protein
MKRAATALIFFLILFSSYRAFAQTVIRATDPSTGASTNVGDATNQAIRVTLTPTGAVYSFNWTQLLGAAPSATNPMPSRLTDGTVFIDPRSIRVLTSGDTVTVVQPTGTNLHVVVDTAPTTSVTGTFFQATQPVSAAALPLPAGAATSALQTTANTSLSSIDTKLTNPLPVSGTVTTGGLTDTQLRASAVPISVATMPSTPVTGTFFQATQPVSAASLPLPAGASTSALQTTGNTSLSTIATNTPAVGQAAMAASSPVVIASNQSSVPVTLPTTTATGSMANPGDTLTVSTLGMATVTGQLVSGSTSQNYFLEAQVDGSAVWDPLLITYQYSLSVGTPSIASIVSSGYGNKFSVSVAGYKFARMRNLSGATTETWTISASPAPISGLTLTQIQLVDPLEGTVNGMAAVEARSLHTTLTQGNGTVIDALQTVPTGSEMGLIVRPEALVAGSAIIGKTTTDQTTHGTTDLVAADITKVGGSTLTLGQQTAANSIPVILPSATITTLTPPVAITGFALEAGHIASIDTKTPALGQATMANSEPVVIASNQSNVPTSKGQATAVTGTLTNPGDTVQIDVTGMSSVMYFGTGGVTPAPSAQISMDAGTNWTANWACLRSTDGTTVSAPTLSIASITFVCPIPAGVNLFRLSANGTGSTPVRIVAGNTTAGVMPLNGMLSSSPSGSETGMVVRNIPSGTQAVSLATAPTTPVTGTFWQTTQPVSGTVTTAPPSNASTNIAQFGGSTVTLGQQVAASSMPVILPSATVTALTPPTTVAVTQATGTNLHAVIDTGSTTAVTGNVAVTNAGLSNIPAQGQALAAASLPVVLTAIQQTALTPPAAITGFALEAGHLATIDSHTPALGQALAAASVPVILPTATITTLTPPAAITNYANETGGNLAAIKTDVDKIPSQGQALAASSMPVVLTSIQQAALTPPAAITGFALEAGNIATVAGAVSAAVMQENIKQVNGIAVLTGTGAAGTGAQRMTVAVDSATVAGSASLPTGSNVIGHVIADTGSTTAVTGNVTVVQATGTNLHTVCDAGCAAGAPGQTTMALSSPVVIASNQSAVPVTLTSTTVTGNVAVTNAGLSNIPAQGQALAAASLPVVLTAIQQTALTPPAAITGFALDATLTSRAEKTQLTDGTRDGTVKAASTLPLATDTAVVVTPRDPTPDLTATVSISAANAACLATNCVSMTLNGINTILVDVTGGAFVASGLFEATTDGVNWATTVGCERLSASAGYAGATDVNFTAIGRWACLSIAWTGFRVRGNGYTSGTPVVTLRGSTATSAVHLSTSSVTATQGLPQTLANAWPVKITDGTNSTPTMDAAVRSGFQRITDGTNTAAVKAASTAPAATDPALVVTVSPNSPTPLTTDTVASGAITATTCAAGIASQAGCIILALNGQTSIGVSWPAGGTGIETFVVEFANDATGTTWQASYFDLVQTTKVASVTTVNANTAFVAAIIPTGGARFVRVRASAFTSGSTTVTLTASSVHDPSVTYAGVIGSATAPPFAIAVAHPASATALTVTTGQQSQQSVDLGGRARVKNAQDEGRSSIMITVTVAATAVTETLITLTKSAGLAATTTCSSCTITTGKTFRIQAISISARKSTGVISTNVTVNLRAAVAGATTTASPLQAHWVVNLPASTASTLFPMTAIPDGFEILSNGATNTWGLTIIDPGWVTAAQISTFDITLIGFEY